MHIYPEDTVGENFFDIYYHPFKKQIWAVGIVFAIVALSVLSVRHFHRTRQDDQWTRYHETLGTSGGETLDAAERLRRLTRLVDDYPEDSVTPFALAAIANEQRVADDFDAATATLADLEARFPDFVMNTASSTETEGGTTLSRRLRDVLAAEKDWQSATEYEHVWPSGERAALVETTAGRLWIGFYEEQAPDQVASFIAHAKAGDYNGTQVYEIRASASDGKPQLLRAGSRASATERDPAEHDRDEPLHTQEPGPTRFSIKHLRRIVSTVEMPSGESDQRFMIITAADGISRYDGETSPFGAVLDKEGSLEVLDRIANSPTYSTNPATASQDGTFRMRDHPFPFVRIRRVTIWNDEKLEDGHTWDTARYGTDEPEPWEADLPADPTPADLIRDTEGGGDDPEKDDSDDDADEPDDDADGADDDAGDQPGDDDSGE